MAPRVDLPEEAHRRRVEALERLAADTTLPEDTRLIYAQELARARASLEQELRAPSDNRAEIQAQFARQESRLPPELQESALGGFASGTLPDLPGVLPDLPSGEPLPDLPGEIALGGGSRLFSKLEGPVPTTRGFPELQSARALRLQRAQEPLEVQQERAARVTGTLTKAARSAAAGGTLGLSELALYGAERLSGVPIRERLEQQPEIESAGGLPALSEMLGFIGGVGAIQRGVIAPILRFGAGAAKGTRAAGPMARLAGEIVGGKLSPRISHGVQLGISSGVATTLTDLFHPDREFSAVNSAVSAVMGGTLGAISVPGARQQLGTQKLLGIFHTPQKFQYGAFNQAVRGAIVGLPVVALHEAITGQPGTTNPFEITGSPYWDQLIFDFGVQLLLSPKPMQIGSRIPILTTTNGKNPKVFGATLLDVPVERGRRRLVVRLDNGLIRPYTPGFPLEMTDPPPRPAAPVAVQGGSLKPGDVAVYTAREGGPGRAQQAGRPRSLVRFERLEGDNMVLGIISTRGETPTTHIVVSKKELRNLAILEPKAVDEMFPAPRPEEVGKGAEVAAAEAEPPAEDVLDVDGHQVVLRYQANAKNQAAVRAALPQILGRIPRNLRRYVQTVRVVTAKEAGPALGRFHHDLGIMDINGDAHPREIRRLGHRLGPMDSLLRTALHEHLHGYNEAFVADMAPRLGWSQFDPSNFRQDASWIPDDSRNIIGDTVGPDGQPQKVLVSVSRREGVWQRPLTQEELTERRIREENKNPSERLTHAMDQYLFFPDDLFAADPGAWNAVHERFGAKLFGVAGATTEGTGQIRMFEEPITAPTGERLEAARARQAREKNLDALITAVMGRTRARARQVTKGEASEDIEYFRFETNPQRLYEDYLKPELERLGLEHRAIGHVDRRPLGVLIEFPNTGDPEAFNEMSLRLEDLDLVYATISALRRYKTVPDIMELRATIKERAVSPERVGVQRPIPEADEPTHPILDAALKSINAAVEKDPKVAQFVEKAYEANVDAVVRELKLPLTADQPLAEGSPLTVGEVARMAAIEQTIRDGKLTMLQFKSRLKQRLLAAAKLAGPAREGQAPAVEGEEGGLRIPAEERFATRATQVVGSEGRSMESFGAEAEMIAAEEAAARGEAVEPTSGAIASTLPEAVAEAEQGGPAPAAGKVRRGKTKMDRLFGKLLTTEEGRAQLREEMAGMSDAQKVAIMRWFGIDLTASPVGERWSLSDIGRQLNMTPEEVGQLFQRLIRTPDGQLKLLEGGKGPDRGVLPTGQRVLPFVEGEAFGAEYNRTKAEIAAEARQEPDLVDQAARDVEDFHRQLQADPDNPNKQLFWRRALSRLHRLTADQAVSGPPEADPGAPKLPFPEAPPPKRLAPWLRQMKTDNLVREWKKARVSQLKDATNERINERVSQLTAEMTRRGLTFPDLSFPTAGGGGGKKPPPEPPGGSGAPDPPSHDRWKQGNLKVRVVEDISEEGQLEAIKHRDLRPKMIVVEDVATGEVYGQWRAWNLKPDFANNPRYIVEPFGYVDQQGRPAPQKKGTFRWTVKDANTGETLGNFTRSGVQQIIGRDHRPFINFDPQSNQAIPHAAEVAAHTADRPEAKAGTSRLTPGEYANLTGEEQLAHIRNFVLFETRSPEEAWESYRDLMVTRGVKNYADRVRDENILMDEVHRKWGPPPNSVLLPTETRAAIAAARRSIARTKDAVRRDFGAYYPKSLGGTEEAYNARAEADALDRITEAILGPEIEPTDPFLFEEGRMLAGANWYSPVVRQMVYFGHPIMKDAYIKARGADAMHGIVLNDWKTEYEAIMGGLTLPEKLAIALFTDGRYAQHAKVAVAKRALVDPDARFAATRQFVNHLFTALSGRPATVDLMVADMTPELELRARQFRGLLDKVADMLHLPANIRLEDYLPHVFRKIRLPGNQGEVLNFWPDMNISSEVFFRFGLPRRTRATDYELNPDDIFDVYSRAAARKLAYQPLLSEFSDPEVLKHLSKDQQRYLKNWMKYLIGDPDPADERLVKYLRALGIESQPGRITTWLRRVALASDAPASKLAAILRGWQFAAKIDFNFVTAAINTSQGLLTTIERHGLFGKGGYLDILKTMGSDQEIRRLFAESGLANEYLRADMGAGQLHKTIRSGIRRLGRRLFTSAERLNRHTAFTAGYMAAAEAGLTGVDRVVAGILESDVTQFNMTRSGRLPLVRRGIPATMFQFAPYRFEMLAHLGGEVARAFHGGRTGRPDEFWLGIKRLFRIALAAHIVGGLDGHVGILARWLGKDDDPEWDGIWGAMDAISADWLLGSISVGRPFEWGHRVNPINLFNRNLTGPTLNSILDGIDIVRGAPLAPTAGQALVRNLPGGVQMERTFGPELQEAVTEPLFGRKQGRLRTVKRQPFQLEQTLEQILQGISGPPPPKGSRGRG